jgi:hypothetical protein
MRFPSAIAGQACRALALAAAITSAWCLDPAPAAPLGQAQSLPEVGPATGLATGAQESPPPTRSQRVRIMDFSSLSGPTAIAFRYTPLVSGAAGQAEIEPFKSAWKIRALFTSLPAASRLGAQYLTYTLWAVTPDGRTTNLGEVELAGSEGHLDTKFKQPRFGLIVTAEPYFAVSQPSSAVVFEADLAPGNAVNIPLTQAECEVLQSPIGSEVTANNASDAKNPPEPLLFDEARRALAVARAAGAADVAPQTLDTAAQTLRIAEKLLAEGAKRQDVHDAVVEAVLIAEDARVLAVARQRRSHSAPVAKDPPP